MDSAIWVQILDKTVYISLCSNDFRKDIVLSLLLQLWINNWKVWTFFVIYSLFLHMTPISSLHFWLVLCYFIILSPLCLFLFVHCSCNHKCFTLLCWNEEQLKCTFMCKKRSRKVNKSKLLTDSPMIFHLFLKKTLLDEIS